jgi:hypothetical protein
LTAVLDQLNLSAVNNRAFSFSKESQQLLENFAQVLKDIIHGAPHAYDDLERLLSREEGQLNKMYNAMPPFLQNLIKSLPTKIAATLAPELLAASSEKPGADMKASATSAASEGSTSSKYNIPSLKRLLSAEGAVATMLRSITNFLKLRFPTLMTGTNLLLSLAVFGKSAAIYVQVTTDLTDQSFNSVAIRILVLPQTWSRGTNEGGSA